MNTGKPLPPYDILIVVSYFHGDREITRRMVDLMVNLEPHHVGRRAMVLLVHRQDTDLDEGMVAKLRTRFDTRTYQSNSPSRGWPAGCNGMFNATIIHIRNEKLPVRCMYWMEGDCVPMHPGWHEKLAECWRRRKPLTLVMGHLCDCVGDGTGLHITGCALYDPEIAMKMPSIGITDGPAWDFGNRRQILARGEHLGIIELAYHKKQAPPELLERGFAVVHGYKDFSLLDLVATKYLTKPAE